MSNEVIAEYIVKTVGCDDQTTVAIILTDSEAAAVRKVSEALNVYADGCHPSLDIIPFMDATSWDIDEADHSQKEN